MELVLIKPGDETKIGFFRLAEFHPNSNYRMSDDEIGQFNVPAILIEAGNLLREAVDAPVTVNSSIRSPKKNQAVGGQKKSLHLPYEEDGNLMTRAVDFGISTGIKDIHVALLGDGPLADELREMGIGGIGLYDTFIHLDVGPKRMWDNRVSTKVGMFNPTIVYYNLMNVLKKKR